jgi:predicted nucleic acid-binding protein
VVLDTNVVLDWLVFRNPQCAPLAAALEQGRLRWLVSEGLRDELAHVLGRGVVSAWQPDEAQLWATWERLSVSVLAPTSTLAKLRCTDADDQKFIDLALAHAQWLLSRDRAVLKLARRAAPLGLMVATPERWAERFTTG